MPVAYGDVCVALSIVAELTTYGVLGSPFWFVIVTWSAMLKPDVSVTLVIWTVGGVLLMTRSTATVFAPPSVLLLGMVTLTVFTIASLELSVLSVLFVGSPVGAGVGVGVVEPGAGLSVDCGLASCCGV